MQKKLIAILMTIFMISVASNAQNKTDIPAVYHNLFFDSNSKLYFLNENGEKVYEKEYKDHYNYNTIFGNPTGTDKGVAFDFGNLNGTLIYGLIPKNDSKYPQPVFLSRPVKIKNGKAEVNIIKRLSGIFDMVSWEKSGYLSLGYRVMNSKGEIAVDSKINLEGKGPFKVIPTIVDGPFIGKLTEHSCVIWFNTNMPVKSVVEVNSREYSDNKLSTHHEIFINKLTPSTNYNYTVKYGLSTETYSFRTANKPGSRKPFVFAYASDSRNAVGGGERDLFGANVYIIKKIFALASSEKVRFIQFTGDLMDGNTPSLSDMKLEYYNWKYAVAPYAHYFPIYTAMGNHENYRYILKSSNGEKYVFDKFPWENNSSESLFKDVFVNPTSDLISEDGSKYDPNPDKIDFPSYDESVFYYTYGNVAVIVLNSDYWYSPSVKNGIPGPGGGLHGYIMDNQLAWLKKTLKQLDNDNRIDHIFVTQHTPALPNGGHLINAMWYYGNNDRRPYIAGKPVDEGIIERRDDYLDLVVNQSKKVKAILTGDEHNYHRTLIEPGIDLYPPHYNNRKIKISRKVYHINNGAAGAPYYAQEQTPWTNWVKKFTTQNALVLFYVNGKKIHVVVKNPDTLEIIEEYDLF